MKENQPPQIKKAEQGPFNLEETLLKYQEQGLELEEKFQPEIKKIVENIMRYYGETSIEIAKERFKNDNIKYNEQIGNIVLNEDILGTFFGQKLQIGINDFNGGYCILSGPEKRHEIGTVPFNVRQMLNDCALDIDHTNVTGVIWPSPALLIGGKSISHNGFWVSPSQRGNGLGYGLYRLNESIFGITKTEHTMGLVLLLKTYLRLGFVAKKSIINSISMSGGKVHQIKINIEDLFQRVLTENKDFIIGSDIYLERESVGGKKLTRLK